jgi:hypothetical protein
LSLTDRREEALDRFAREQGKPNLILSLLIDERHLQNLDVAYSRFHCRSHIVAHLGYGEGEHPATPLRWMRLWWARWWSPLAGRTWFRAGKLMKWKQPFTTFS